MVRKISKKVKIILMVICIFTLFLLFPTLILNFKDKNLIKQALINDAKLMNTAIIENTNYNKIKLYNYHQLKAVMNEENKDNKCKINIDSDNGVVYSNYLKVGVVLSDKNNDNKYSINIKIDDNNIEKIINADNQNFELNNNLQQGKNNVEIDVYENANLLASYNDIIYYIEPYKSQFLDSLNNRGVLCHLYGKKEDDEKSMKFAEISGFRNMRVDYGITLVYNKYSDNFNLNNFKRLENLAESHGINLLLVAEAIDYFSSNKEYPSTQNDYALFKRYANVTNNELISKVEVINEPNFIYNNSKKVNEFPKLVNVFYNEVDVRKLVVGGVAQKWDNAYDPYEFIKLIDEYNHNIEQYSFHYYTDEAITYNNIQKEYTNLFNEFGGFIKKIVSEYGHSTYSDEDENKQGKILIKQTIINDANYIYTSYIYNLVNANITGNNANVENTFGLVTRDYSPKQSFYSLKTLNENTNGAECIGSVALQDGITAYVYDKDGKPKIIIWSDNGEKKIDYTNFKASDLYGNEINPDENNQITVSDSPIYLDNISTDYFYQAISNAITSGYSEFNTKFADEISKVDGLTAKINDLNKQAVNLKNVSTFDENKAKELMKEHFELGNMIMSAYENGKLNVEYVKLSSMLDSLNTIGNSYDDLVTVSAKTRITDLTDITNEVNTAKSLAQSNEKFNIVYPNKIYQFAQDFIDTSSYILGLEEQNDIKTGLINSKALHAKYLAEWSQKFSKIYINDALKDSINTITATNSEIKQKYSNILLNNEVSSCYNGISDSIKELSTNIENCNLDNVDSLYNKELDFAKLIANKYYSKELNIKESDFKELEKKLFYTLSSFEGLYKYYVSEDNISQDKVADTLNNIVKLYDENTDIDLSTETEMIKNLKSTYEGLNSVEDSGAKYFEKLNINKTCELISTILEGDIKNKADSEYKAIKATSNTDLSKLTNKDVLISIKIPNDNVKITNNKGSVNITFDENGDFTYEIDIRGYKYTYKVTVNNIDKTRPKLNVTSTGTSIKSTATDDNLKELKVEKDGKTISYKQGEELTTPGIYKITAIDKANNQTTSKEIVYGIFKNTSNNDVKYVPTNANKLKAKTLKENSNFTLKDNNQEIADDANVATGNKLSKDGQEYTIIVKGDITKNGEVGTLDLIALRKNIVGLTKLENEQALAADLDDDGKVNVLDLINERKRMVGIE